MFCLAICGRMNMKSGQMHLYISTCILTKTVFIYFWLWLYDLANFLLFLCNETLSLCTISWKQHNIWSIQPCRLKAAVLLQNIGIAFLFLLDEESYTVGIASVVEEVLKPKPYICWFMVNELNVYQPITALVYCTFLFLLYHFWITCRGNPHGLSKRKREWQMGLQI